MLLYNNAFSFIQKCIENWFSIEDKPTIVIELLRGDNPFCFLSPSIPTTNILQMIISTHCGRVPTYPAAAECCQGSQSKIMTMPGAAGLYSDPNVALLKCAPLIFN